MALLIWSIRTKKGLWLFLSLLCWRTIHSWEILTANPIDASGWGNCMCCMNLLIDIKKACKAAFPQAEENRDSAEAQSTSIMLQFSLSCWRLNAANRSFADIMLSASTLYLMSQPQLYVHVVFYCARLRTVESLQNPFKTTMWLLERSVSMWLRHDLLLQLFDLSTLSWMNIGTPMFTRFLEWAITVAWIWRQWPQRLCLLLAKLGIDLGGDRMILDCRLPQYSSRVFAMCWYLSPVFENPHHPLCNFHICYLTHSCLH